jgi:subfamily B ATP-binding cassette protein MsbA
VVAQNPIFATMKNFWAIYRLALTYKWMTFSVVFFNFLFVIFNLLSMVMFVPFLQLIFGSKEEVVAISEPIRQPGFVGFFKYGQEYYDYFMRLKVSEDATQALTFVCIAVFISFLLKNIFRYASVWQISQLRMAVVRDIRDQIYDKSLRLPLSFYSNEKKGDLMSRMNNDANEIELGITAILELIYREPFAIILTISLLVYWSPQLTLISFILLPISAFVISRIGKSLKRTAKQEKKQLGVLNSNLDETLSGIRIIKAFNAIEYMGKKFKSVNLIHQKLITKTFRKKDLSSPLNETIGAAVMLAIAWFGGSIILDSANVSDLSGEKFLGFIIVFSQLLRPIQGISNSVALLNKASASQDRINEILNSDEKIIEHPQAVHLPAFNQGISFKNVRFKYDKEFVINDVSFELNKGRKVALVGESGSGKSTIADLLPRFYDINAGEILFDGVALNKAKIRDLREHIGIVSQESILFNDSVANNIAFGRETVDMEKVIEAAKIANAHEFIINLENGYDTNIGERGGKLSGGQRQRLSIARAILKNPSILILDEATSALDTESEKLVQDAIERLMENRTSLVIAHRLSTVINADEIHVLSKGKIVESGTHEELMKREGNYFRLCNLQGIFT